MIFLDNENPPGVERTIMNPTNGFIGHLVLSSITAAGLLLITTTGQAASFTWNIHADGIKEVNASGVPSGDPDGSAVGTLMLNDGTGGTTGFAVFNLTLANIDFPLTAYHIHQAPTTTSGPVFLGFGNPETIRSGNSLSGTVPNLSSSAIDSILANPTAFYLNLHNNPFPSGAVRDQLTAVPEPSTVALGLLAACGLGFVAHRNRKQRR